MMKGHSADEIHCKRMTRREGRTKRERNARRDTNRQKGSMKEGTVNNSHEKERRRTQLQDTTRQKHLKIRKAI